MKTCPYAISGALANSKLFADIVVNANRLRAVDITSGDWNMLICRENGCGRYAACKPQVQIGHKLDNFMGSNLSTRAKKILARALSKYSDTEVKRMPKHKWLRFDDCGEGTTKEILKYLHGREDDA